MMFQCFVFIQQHKRFAFILFFNTFKLLTVQIFRNSDWCNDNNEFHTHTHTHTKAKKKLNIKRYTFLRSLNYSTSIECFIWNSSSAFHFVLTILYFFSQLITCLFFFFSYSFSNWTECSHYCLFAIEIVFIFNIHLNLQCYWEKNHPKTTQIKKIKWIFFLVCE